MIYSPPLLSIAEPTEPETTTIFTEHFPEAKDNQDWSSNISRVKFRMKEAEPLEVPLEICQLIASVSNAVTLKQLRGINKTFCAAATKPLFRTVYFGPYKYCLDNLVKISQAPHLRAEVSGMVMCPASLCTRFTPQALFEHMQVAIDHVEAYNTGIRFLDRSAEQALDKSEASRSPYPTTAEFAKIYQECKETIHKTGLRFSRVLRMQQARLTEAICNLPNLQAVKTWTNTWPPGRVSSLGTNLGVSLMPSPVDLHVFKHLWLLPCAILLPALHCCNYENDFAEKQLELDEAMMVICMVKALGNRANGIRDMGVTIPGRVAGLLQDRHTFETITDVYNDMSYDDSWELKIALGGADVLANVTAVLCGLKKLSIRFKDRGGWEIPYAQVASLLASSESLETLDFTGGLSYTNDAPLRYLPFSNLRTLTLSCLSQVSGFMLTKVIERNHGTLRNLTLEDLALDHVGPEWFFVFSGFARLPFLAGGRLVARKLRPCIHHGDFHVCEHCFSMMNDPVWQQALTDCVFGSASVPSFDGESAHYVQPDQPSPLALLDRFGFRSTLKPKPSKPETVEELLSSVGVRASLWQTGREADDEAWSEHDEEPIDANLIKQYEELSLSRSNKQMQAHEIYAEHGKNNYPQAYAALLAEVKQLEESDCKFLYLATLFTNINKD